MGIYFDQNLLYIYISRNIFQHFILIIQSYSTVCHSWLFTYYFFDLACLQYTFQPPGSSSTITEDQYLSLQYKQTASSFLSIRLALRNMALIANHHFFLLISEIQGNLVLPLPTRTMSRLIISQPETINIFHLRKLRHPVHDNQLAEDNMVIYATHFLPRFQLNSF